MRKELREHLQWLFLKCNCLVLSLVWYQSIGAKICPTRARVFGRKDSRNRQKIQKKKNQDLAARELSQSSQRKWPFYKNYINEEYITMKWLSLTLASSPFLPPSWMHESIYRWEFLKERSYSTFWIFSLFMYTERDLAIVMMWNLASVWFYPKFDCLLDRPLHSWTFHQWTFIMDLRSLEFIYQCSPTKLFFKKKKKRIEKGKDDK